MAEHKGYAIAALVDVLSGVLPGAQFLSAVNGPYHYDKLSGVGHFLTVHDVAAFCDPAEFGERMDRFIAEIKAVPLAKGTDEIFYPGEMEEMKNRAQRQSGLLLPADTWSDLQKVAASTGTQAALESAAMTAA
jgi:LDH2 family malate/lactate/ureidoglycolate dehydrogenase